MIFIEPINSKYHPFIVEWRHLNHLLRQIDSPFFAVLGFPANPTTYLLGETNLSGNDLVL